MCFSMGSSTHLSLHAVKEWRRKVGIEEIWAALEELGILGVQGQWSVEGQLQGHTTTTAGSSIGPHMGSHVNLDRKRKVPS